MKLKRLLQAASWAVCSTVLAGAAVHAQTVEEFYSENDVTLVVSAAPSGGADIYARAFAPIFAKHIPGNPNVIVTNVPGASGLTAGTRLQNQTEADGTTVALLQSNNLYIPFIREGAVPFDPREVDWLGSLARNRHVLVTWHTSGLKSFEDLIESEEPVIVGATTLNQINGTLPELVRQAFPDSPIEIVTGYEGTGEILLAMQRGEVHVRSQSVASLLGGSERKYLETGELVPLVQLTPKGHSGLEGTPLITEFVDPELISNVFDFFFLPVAASRPFAVPKGVPEDRLAALRAAFEAAAADPEFAEATAKLGSDPELLTGQDVADIVDRIYRTTDEVAANFRQFLN